MNLIDSILWTEEIDMLMLTAPKCICGRRADFTIRFLLCEKLVEGFREFWGIHAEELIHKVETGEVIPHTVRCFACATQDAKNTPLLKKAVFTLRRFWEFAGEKEL